MCNIRGRVGTHVLGLARECFAAADNRSARCLCARAGLASLAESRENFVCPDDDDN